MSVLVRATRPLWMCSSEQIAKCSRVCGITPSSAAITSMARSMPPMPASMFFTKRSWPGTSTISIVRPSGSSRKAKPRSIVMPRAFSSGRRSVSMPVSAFTSDVLPWSMCPAVPTTTWWAPPCACRASERLDQLRHLPRQHRPAVEEQAIVHEPADDRRHRRRAPSRRARGRRHRWRPGQPRGGQLHGGQRAAADLRAPLDDPRPRRSTTTGPRPRRTRRARAVMLASGSVRHASVGTRLSRRPRLVGGERRLQRGDRELVDAQGPVPGVLLQARDDRLLADDDAGLRPAEQLVAENVTRSSPEATTSGTVGS